MKKALFILPLLFLFGCHSDSHNLDIAVIDQQISSLRNHILDISDEEGVYQNENIDLQLLKEIKENTIEKGYNNIDLYNDGKLTMADMDETLNKMLSVLYFVWMEELDSAQSNTDVSRLNNLQLEHDQITSPETIQSYLTKNDQLNNYANVREIFKKIPVIANQKMEIENQNMELENIKTELDELKMNNRIGDYNDKVEIYNAKVEANESLIKEYNENIGEYNNEYIYDNFIKLIDINILFPKQDTIELTK